MSKAEKEFKTKIQLVKDSLDDLEYWSVLHGDLVTDEISIINEMITSMEDMSWKLKKTTL